MNPADARLARNVQRQKRLHHRVSVRLHKIPFIMRPEIQLCVVAPVQKQPNVSQQGVKSGSRADMPSM